MILLKRQSSKMDNKRVALVTGSTSGIGLGIARTLASRGYRVILTGFGEEHDITLLVEEIKSTYGIQAHYIFADLSKPSDINDMWRQIKEIYPRGVDVLVNNAGLQHKAPIEEYPVEQWDLLLSVLLSAPFHLIKLMLPDMRSKGWGRIINISSVMGLVGREFGAAYCSAKHGLVGLTKVVALETAGSGVTCNAVCPGYVDTPLVQDMMRKYQDKHGLTAQQTKEYFVSVQSHKEFIPIDQVTDLVAYLCSDSASSMTGSALNIDCGYLAQ